MTVVDVCRGSLVRAQVGARRGTEAILLHTVYILSVSTYIYISVSVYLSIFVHADIGIMKEWIEPKSGWAGDRRMTTLPPFSSPCSALSHSLSIFYYIYLYYLSLSHSLLSLSHSLSLSLSGCSLALGLLSAPDWLHLFGN